MSHRPGSETLKRSSLRFPLWMVFIGVALFGGWLAYELNWIRERRAAISSGEVGLIVSASPFVPHSPHPPPWHLRLFGEQEIYAHGLVIAQDATDPDFRRIRRLFPELKVEPFESGSPRN